MCWRGEKEIKTRKGGQSERPGRIFRGNNEVNADDNRTETRGK